MHRRVGEAAGRGDALAHELSRALRVIGLLDPRRVVGVGLVAELGVERAVVDRARVAGVFVRADCDSHCSLLYQGPGKRSWSNSDTSIQKRRSAAASGEAGTMAALSTWTISFSVRTKSLTL